MIVMGRNRTTPGGGGGNAMENDTSALYWFDGLDFASSTVGSDITAWSDSTGNHGDLVQDGSVDVPTVNATQNGAAFDGTQKLELVLNSLTDTGYGNVYNNVNGGGFAMWIVCQCDFSGIPANAWWPFIPFMEGQGDGGPGTIARPSLQSYGTPSGSHKLFQNGWSFYTYDFDPLQSPDWNQTQLEYKQIIEVVVDRTNTNVYVETSNGDTSSDTATTDTTALDDVGYDFGFGMGAPYSNTVASLVGEVFGVFCTSDVSASHTAAVRADMITRYGV